MYYSAYVHREGRHWLADFPDAPGCQTFADSHEELRSAAQEAIEGWLEAHLIDGQAPPKPRHRRPRTGRALWQVNVSAPLTAALSIRWARQDLGLTQAQLAKRLKVTQQQVAKLENPNENPTLKAIEKVATALGLEMNLSFE